MARYKNGGGPSLCSLALIGAGALLLLISVPSWLWAAFLGLVLIAAGLILWRLG